MASVKLLVVFFAALSIVSIFDSTSAMPTFVKRFEPVAGLDYIQICLNNCAQCKRMFGKHFQGQTCAESCLSTKGMAIPDCENYDTIANFINTLE